MNSSMVENHAAVATVVQVTDDTLAVELSDGRMIAVPLSWYPRLVHATKKERNARRLIAGGRGIHWPDIDEDISVVNLLVGQPSGESQGSFKKWLAERAKKGRSSGRAGA